MHFLVAPVGRLTVDAPQNRLQIFLPLTTPTLYLNIDSRLHISTPQTNIGYKIKNKFIH